MRLHCLVGFLFICAFAFFSRAIRAAENGGSENVNVAALNQLLANVQPNQKLVTIGDMQFPVGTITAFRDQLAGAPSPQSAFQSPSQTWPNGNIYYEFSTAGTNAVPANLQKAFLDAAGEWAMFANLHFIARTTQTNYVLVQVDQSLEGGQSAVGMIGGEQMLSVSPNAWNRGTLCHEIGHTLGLIHEHQRSDRDSFVTIITNNIVPGGLGNFVLVPNSINVGPYDFLSVMHYARNYLSTDTNLDTIVPLPAFTQYINVMGEPGPIVLSAGDRAGMAAVYGAGPVITPVVTNTLDSGHGSLRAALYYAFDYPGTRITFNVATTDSSYTNGIFTIQPSDQLPALVNATILEGASQPATFTNTDAPNIVINGALAPVPSTFANGLHLSGTNCIVHALTINGFSASSILLDGTNTTDNTIAGCYLGIDATGNIPVTNGLSPITISSGANGNLIGGTSATNRNVISGGVFQGIFIHDPGTDNNLVEGNYIGLNAAGTTALPNGFAGVEIAGGAQRNIIGGTTPGARNIISGNTDQGVAMDGVGTTGNIGEGNYIGLNPSGTAAIPNGFSGAEMFSGAQSNIVGGLAPGAGNVISGNLFQGIVIDGDGTTGNLVEGNYIGLSASGTAAIPNGGAGVGIFSAAAQNIIGGTTAAARNIISGNTQQGVAIGNADTSSNIVEGNYIGLNPTGTVAIANTFPGVNLFDGASGNLIGGISTGAGNVISGNAGQGVSAQDAGTSGNFIQGNLIGLNAAGTAAVANTGVGIEMFDDVGPNIISGGNVISGNGDDGVLFDNGASSNVVAGNFIGLDLTGMTAIPNAGSGVEMFVGANNNLVGGAMGRNYISGNTKSGVLIDDGASFDAVLGNTIGLNIAYLAVPNLNAGVGLFDGAQSNHIGGILPGQANLIADNLGGGVELYDTNTIDNSVRGNSIFGNATGFGIYLFLANNSAAAPAFNLSSATLTTNLTTIGNVSGSAPLTAYQLDFYANSPSATLAEATTYIGGTAVVTGADGSASFTVQLNAIIPIGNTVVASITDPSGNTSMFSPGVMVTGADSIHDGITDAWRVAHFGSATPTNAQSCATCDPDHDGLNNLQEFFAGTDPNDSSSALRSGSLTADGNDLVLSFSTVSGITYRVEYKNDLTTGSWLLLADQILGTGNTIQLTDPNAAPTGHRYYRVEVLP